MIEDTRIGLHFGVNFVFSPPVLMDSVHLRQFEGAMAERLIEFDLRQARPQGGMAFRRSEGQLEVGVGPVGPGAPIAQLVIRAPQPRRLLEEFVGEATEIVDAFYRVWDRPIRIVARDCTIRHLYAVHEPAHAFQFLWENRLKQQPGSLEVFGRQVLGGGLRLVMPAMGGSEEGGVHGPEGPETIELKIESYLRDSSKLYVDVAFQWPTPQAVEKRMDAKSLLERVHAFAVNEVVRFLQEPTG